MVSVVSKPFSFEGSARMQLAEAGINELIPQVESLIVIPNETFLIGVNENTGVDECFKNTVGSITDIITNPSLVAVDFKDVCTVMGGMGLAATGSGGHLK